MPQQISTKLGQLHVSNSKFANEIGPDTQPEKSRNKLKANLPSELIFLTFLTNRVDPETATFPEREK